MTSLRRSTSPHHRTFKNTKRVLEKLPMDVAIEIASHITAAAVDPMEDLGSLWVTCSQMRRVCGDAVVGQSIPLWWVLLRGIQLWT